MRMTRKEYKESKKTIKREKLNALISSTIGILFTLTGLISASFYLYENWLEQPFENPSSVLMELFNFPLLMPMAILATFMIFGAFFSAMLTNRIPRKFSIFGLEISFEKKENQE